MTHGTREQPETTKIFGFFLNLTTEEKQAFDEMLDTKTIEEYLKSIAKSHISQKLDEELLAKTDEEKKQLLG